MRKKDNAPPSGPNSGYGGWGKQFRDWITANLPEGKIILELGSGIGTRFLCKRWKVRSVEHNGKWLNVAGQSEYFHAEINRGWYDVEMIKKAVSRPYDLLIIDGPPGTIGRGGIIRNIGLFDLSKMIIVDDINRNPEFLIALQIEKLTGRKMRIIQDELKQFAVI